MTRSLTAAAAILALLVFAPAGGALPLETSGTVTANASAPWIVLGARLAISGTVSPHPQGVTATLQRKIIGTWLPVVNAKLTPSGSYSFRATPAKPGSTVYRVVGSVGGSSPRITVRVVHWSFLGDTYARPAAGDLVTDPLLTNGQTDPHPVALDAGCYNGVGGDAWVTYPLAKSYEQLTATMSLAGYLAAASTASYQVIGDGKVLSRGSLAPGEATKLNVSLDGLSNLKLFVNVPDPDDTGGCGLDYTAVDFGDAEVLGPSALSLLEADTRA